MEQSEVQFTGEITVRTIVAAREKLAESLRQSVSVLLNIGSVASVDLTFVQLIESARLSAARDGKTLGLTSAATGPVLEALQRGGFLGARAAEQSGFWLEPSGAQT